jgi:AcrR family transcriptional regulator
MPPRRADDRSDQILDAASRVFARLGLGQARMDDVAAESRLGKGTLYLYFRSKDQLIDALVARLIGIYTRRLAAIRSSGGTASERLATFVDEYVGEIVRLAPLSPVIVEVYARAARHATVRELLRRYFTGFRGELAGLIGDGVASGEFRATDPDAVAVALTGQLEGLALLWLLDRDHVDIVEIARQALRLLIAGLSPASTPDREVTV